MLFLKWFTVILLILLFIGFSYERISRLRLERLAGNDRTFVNINGKPIHYVKKGDGGATVVFVSGMGSGHHIWQALQHDVSKHAVTLSYDRNGILFSPTNGGDISNEAVSQELEALLNKVDCPKPYILVMHSMAAVYMRPFIARHRADIRGLIFAEAAHPKQLRDASEGLLKTRFIPPTWFVKTVVDIGLYRGLFSILPISNEIPLDHPLHRQEKDFFYKSYKRLLHEVSYEAQNFDDAQVYDDFGDIPLIVISGTSEKRYQSIKDPVVREEYRNLLQRMAKDFLHLSTKSRMVKTPHSAHILQIYDNKLLYENIKSLL